MNADDLAKILDELGQRLGPTGEHVFALAVRQAVIENGLWVVVGLLLIGIAVPIWRVVHHYIDAEWARWDALPEREKQYPYSNGKPSTGAVLWYLVPGGIAGVGAFFALLSLPALLNPEYAALRDLLGAIR